MFNFLSGSFHLLFLHHCHLFEDGVAITAVGAGDLITILRLEMFNEPFQLLVIQLNQVPHL